MSNKHEEDAIIRSLLNAGIRHRYHKKTLAEDTSTNAPMLKKWVDEDSHVDPSTGFTFIGDNSMEDLAILVARGLHLTGRAMRVFTLLYFQRLLADDPAYLRDHISSCRGLLITQMGPYDKRADACFTHYQVRQIEDILLNWIMDGGRILIHAEAPLAGGWFSGSFVQRVAAVNETIIGG